MEGEWLLAMIAKQNVYVKRQEPSNYWLFGKTTDDGYCYCAMLVRFSEASGCPLLEMEYYTIWTLIRTMETILYVLC